MRVPGDAYDYGERSSSGTHGVVLTKPHVVELILDLAGYTTDRDLGTNGLMTARNADAGGPRRGQSLRLLW